MRKVGAILLLVLALQLALSSAIPTPFASFVSKKKARSAPRQQISKGTKQETPKAVNSAKGATTRPPVDFKAIGKYVGSLAVQMSALFLVWSCIDTVVTAVPNGEGLPRWTNTILFYALNLLSSKFNPLPKVSEGSYASPGRKRPSWTPPGWVFAVMWPFFVFGTRAYTMALIVEKVGYYANPITMSLMLHLGFATLWNSINRVEERLGVSVLMLYGMVATKAFTAYLAYQTSPGAGIALAATLSWLLAAAALGTHTWMLNPDSSSGRRDSLYPAKRG